MQKVNEILKINENETNSTSRSKDQLMTFDNTFCITDVFFTM